jgi:hypothetical protein
MAELLVMAKKHWLDDVPMAEVLKFDHAQSEGYNARSGIGDVIVAKPDGWPWGREECLPNYIVIKLPGVKVEDVEYLTRPLYEKQADESLKILKRRRFKVNPEEINKLIEKGYSVHEFKGQIDQSKVLSGVMDKVL